MANWVFKGLASGVVTTKYPRKREDIPGGWPGLPVVAGRCPDDCLTCLKVCPVGAIDIVDGILVIDYKRCLFCRRCVSGCPAGVLQWESDFRTAFSARAGQPLRRFSHSSIFIRHVDAGACECCLWEAGAVAHPHYDLHRLGFFFVTSPRHADILLVSGPVTVNMAKALEKTYLAMPQPKKVVALGGCACGGAMFGQVYATPFRLEEIMPVDVFIPGCPPPPLGILHGLLVAAGRAVEATRTKAEQLKAARS